MKKSAVLGIVAVVITAFISGAYLGIGHGESAVINGQIVYGSGNTFYSDYEGEVNEYHYEGNAMTLRSITNLMGEDWQQVVIKQGTKIIYSGDSKNVPQDYNNLIVENIANCDDDFAITIFVK